jgi:hypothetical protein
MLNTIIWFCVPKIIDWSWPQISLEANFFTGALLAMVKFSIFEDQVEYLNRVWGPVPRINSPVDS